MRKPFKAWGAGGWALALLACAACLLVVRSHFALRQPQPPQQQQPLQHATGTSNAPPRPQHAAPWGSGSGAQGSNHHLLRQDSTPPLGSTHEPLPNHPPDQELHRKLNGTHPSHDTLVVFAFANISAMHDYNLRFFLRHAVIDDANVHYVIVCNEKRESSYKCLEDLTELPPNVKVLRRENHCMDLGSWLHGLNRAPGQGYKTYIFLNASVRGPFMAPSLSKVIGNRWDKVFASALDDDVKLVGMSVNCGGIEGYAHPHVQSMIWAVDAVGLQVLQTSPAFLCDDDWYDRSIFIQNHEMGISREILEAGYNMGSLLIDQQGVDFRDRTNWDCNGRVRRDVWDAGWYLHGIDVHPLETLFFKTNRNIPSATDALVRYGEVMDNQWLRENVPTGATPLPITKLSFPPKASRDVTFTIVIAVSSRWRKLDKSLKSLLSQRSSTFETVIVYDESNPATSKHLYELQNRKHVPEITHGSFRVVTQPATNYFLNAVAQGIRLARGKYVVILDAGTKLRRDALPDLQRLFAGDSTIDLLAADRNFRNFLSDRLPKARSTIPTIVLRRHSTEQAMELLLHGNARKNNKMAQLQTI